MSATATKPRRSAKAAEAPAPLGYAVLGDAADMSAATEADDYVPARFAEARTPRQVRAAKTKPVKDDAGIVIANVPVAPEPTRTRTSSGVTLRDLLAAGVVDAGRVLTATYKGKTYNARLLADGSVEWEGTVYASPSLAAGMVRKSVIGAPKGYAFPQTNGWTFWHLTSETGDLQPLAALREGRTITVVAESAPRSGRLPDPAKVARVRKAKALLASLDTLGGPAYTEAMGSDEAQAALETAADASLGADRSPIED